MWMIIDWLNDWLFNWSVNRFILLLFDLNHFDLSFHCIISCYQHSVNFVTSLGLIWFNTRRVWYFGKFEHINMFELELNFSSRILLSDMPAQCKLQFFYVIFLRDISLCTHTGSGIYWEHNRSKNINAFFKLPLKTISVITFWLDPESRPVFCLCPVISRAKPELAPSKRQKTGPGLTMWNCHVPIWPHNPCT